MRSFSFSTALITFRSSLMIISMMSRTGVSRRWLIAASGLASLDAATTALDAAGEGFRTRVLLGLTAGVSSDTVESALEQLREAGVELAGEPVVAA